MAICWIELGVPSKALDTSMESLKLGIRVGNAPFASYAVLGIGWAMQRIGEERMARACHLELSRGHFIPDYYLDRTAIEAYDQLGDVLGLAGDDDDRELLVGRLEELVAMVDQAVSSSRSRD
jgi:hypothetical protein